MTSRLAFLRPHATRLLAIGLILVFYGLARLPELPAAAQDSMAAQFKFSRIPLPELQGYPQHTVRAVNPSLERISAWISSVGAAVALNDLDGDGLPNDVCYVDTRIDQVVVGPVPGTPPRYPPFALNPAPLHYNVATMAPMGCLPGDFNEDGLMDILVYYWGRTPILFLRSGPAGAAALSNASYVRQELLPGQDRWYTDSATTADLDGDGHADLIIGNYFPDGARILDATASDTEQMQHSMSRAYNGGGDRILRWTGATAGANPQAHFAPVDGVFDDEVAHGWTLAVGAADLDGDLLPELYFANDFGPDRLLHNVSTPGHIQFRRLEGIKGFTTPNSKTLGRDSFKGMGVDFGDLNGDGLLDMFVSNITAPYSLLESNFAWISTGETARMRDGVAPYTDQSEQLGLSRGGWAWDSHLDDFNNDGVLEAMQATGFVKGDVNRWPELQELATGNDELLSDPGSWPRIQPGDDLSGHQANPFFVRAADGRYYDLSAALGLDQTDVSRGIATADVDGDGRLDFAIANQWDTSYFYQNQSPNAGRALDLRVLLPIGASEGTTKVLAGHPGGVLGYPAIGAAAKVTLPDGRVLVAQVDGGNGHSGKRSNNLHFGLGATPANRAVPVDLSWRDARGQTHRISLRLTPGWYTVLLGN